jgi:hypothetical protein
VLEEGGTYIYIPDRHDETATSLSSWDMRLMGDHLAGEGAGREPRAAATPLIGDLQKAILIARL